MQRVQFTSVTGVAAGLALGLVACGPSASSVPSRGEAASIHLAEAFDEANVEGELPEVEDLLVIDWRFDRPFEPLPVEESNEEPEPEPEPEPEADEDPEDPQLSAPGPSVHGVEAVVGIEGLAVADGRLSGTSTGPAALRFERRPEGDDELYGVELRLAVSAGEKLGLAIETDAEIDRKEMREDIAEDDGWPQSANLIPGDGIETYLIELPSRVADSSRVRHVILQPSDADAASFEIESLRLVSMREHLAGQTANMDWRGLGEVYRQTLLMHVTETVHFDLTLPSQPRLELALGTKSAHPTTFLVHLTRAASDEPATRLLRRTLTTEDRWEDSPLELVAWAGERVRLTFEVESEHAEQVGYFGTPVIRNLGATPAAGGRPLSEAPRGVIVVLADTLRRDHLEAYGYERETAPYLARLAREGALFKDNISQASWTKVSVPSILSSMYPSSNGVQKSSDKLPFSVTTLAEVFQAAGYATFATSSVPFSGRASNLHQGVDVLHERGSVGDLGHSGSKTARVYVDRLTRWIEDHREQPFFAFLHVFDPHSPFDTYSPYLGMWSPENAREDNEADVERVKEVDDDVRRGGDELPDRAQFEKAGVAPEPFVAREKNMYDESIRAMDAEIARLFERLEELDLAESTLLVFVSDHGEEFLEHGRHFHGNNTYGEMTNVPLMFWGPRWVPSGVVVPETVQSIDLYPTLLELCGLELPELAQGQSLVPLMRGGEGFRPRPAFAARFSSKKSDPEPDDIGSFAMVAGGYRLVHNVVRPAEHPEFELYDHVEDPINLYDLAAEMPERVEAMAAELAVWRKWAEANRLDAEGGTQDLNEEDLEQLRALGYAGD